MTATALVAVVIPTFGRGERIFRTLEVLLRALPLPSEILVHVDQSDGRLESRIENEFPSVKVLSSKDRLGPGGGRHRCLEACRSPYAASFDDDSIPLDLDFFQRVAELFSNDPSVAVLAATIWHPGETPEPSDSKYQKAASFTGCGYALRLSAYRQTRGYLCRPVAYGIEEVDLSLQLSALGWEIRESGRLRVLHETNLAHREHASVAEGMVSNVGLLAFLRYPVSMWGWAMLQVCNMLRFTLSKKQWRGSILGLMRIPFDCWQYRRERAPLTRQAVRNYLQSRSRLRE